MALLTSALLIISFITTACACNGMQIKNLKMNSCDGQNLVSNVNFTASLDKDCKLISQGCVKLENAIENGNATYNMEKKGMPPIKIHGNKDICELVASSKGNGDVEMALKTVSAPKQCPLPKGLMCAKDPVNIGKYKSSIKAAAGDFTGKVTGITSAGKFCLDISLTIENQNNKQSFGQFG